MLVYAKTAVIFFSLVSLGVAQDLRGFFPAVPGYLEIENRTTEDVYWSSLEITSSLGGLSVESPYPFSSALIDTPDQVDLGVLGIPPPLAAGDLVETGIYFDGDPTSLVTMTFTAGPGSSLSRVEVFPEPDGVTLAAYALAGLLFRRRRRRECMHRQRQHKKSSTQDD